MVHQVPPPDTGWLPPKEFPNLSGAKVLGLDTETKDLRLLEKGPGPVRGDGHAVGVSISAGDASWYFPIRHEYGPQKHLNLEPEKVFAWLRETLGRGIPIVGANLLYDLEVLRAEGVEVTGDLYDVQVAEPLIDENARTYALDNLGKKYLGKGKETFALYDWCSKSFGGEANGTQREEIWRSPPTLVGPYAETDAQQPLEILAKQRKILFDEELTDLFKMECGLIPLLLDMRFRGVRIDEDKARKTSTWLKEQARIAQALIPDIDVWANESIARAFEREHLEYSRTEAGNPSFTKQFLESLEHPLAKAILDVRLYEKAANPFVDHYLLDNLINGRVHCQFNPLRTDEYGTVSGRFSSSNPNLQNIPIRHKVIGPLLRSLFIPEEGMRWRRHDYSQIEYRALAHYAVGRRSDEIRERYNRDPKTDFHDMVIVLVDELTGVVLDRRPAKNLNFGLVFGMGKDKLVRSLGLDFDLGERLYNAYFEAVPSARATYKGAERLARRRGYIKTLLKRRRRFKDEEGCHKALNALLQGTAADIIKKAMHDIWKAGLTKILPLHLTVHDELDWSDPRTPAAEEAFAEVRHILTSCVKMRVPLMVEESVGANWGECK